MKQLILNSESTSQMVVDYINSANQVCGYAMSIATTQLPALVFPPANYGNFVQTFAKARLDVLIWLDEVVPDFNLLPTALINYNTLFQFEATQLLGYLNQLKTSPGDPAILNNIQTSATALINQANACENTITGLDNNITSYQATIAPDATVLNGLCIQISAAEGVDEASVAMLNAVLNNLQSIVDDRNKLITLSTLADITEGIFIAAVGTAVGIVFTGTAGVIIGLGFGVGSAVFTTLEPVGPTIEYQETLQDIQNDMDSVNSEIGLLNSTVGLLQNLNAQFTAIVAQSGVAETNIQTILAFWQQLQQDTNQIITDLDELLTADSINQAISDLQAAANAWDAIETTMQNIVSVTYNVDTAIGMAPSVEAVVNGGA